MTDEQKKDTQENLDAEGVNVITGQGEVAAPVSVESVVTPARNQQRRNQQRDRAASTGAPRRNSRRQRSEGKVRPEFDQKIIDIRRVARVVAGGRRFNFSVSLVIGDHKGSVGVGLGKGGDTALAIEKALRNAKKNLVKILDRPRARPLRELEHDQYK